MVRVDKNDRARFQDLHNAIAVRYPPLLVTRLLDVLILLFPQGCDEVLKSVESYLTRFQTDLGAVSAEIETLQSRSIQLNSQLENRRNVERLLGPAVEEISISPKTVYVISEGPVSQDWVKALNEIEARSASIEGNAPDNVKALADVTPLLMLLKDKVRRYM
jgi:hypothetical protein